MRTHVATVQGTFSCTGKGKLKMGSVLLSASNHSTWSRGAQKHRATVPRCSPALLRDVLQHLTPTCKAGEQRVETRTESPGRKKGYKHVKTRRKLRAGCAFFTDFTKNCTGSLTKPENRRQPHPARRAPQPPELAQLSISLPSKSGSDERKLASTQRLAEEPMAF